MFVYMHITDQALWSRKI